VKPLRAWSARRVAIASLVWLVGLPLLTAPALFGAAGWLARAEMDRRATSADSVGAPALRGVLPPQPDDFDIVAGPAAALVIGLLLLPPVALWMAWIVARRRGAGA
jgi:hypothetical protein